jgi:hypothetical protein
VTQIGHAATMVGMMVFVLAQIAALVIAVGALIHSVWLTHRAVVEFEASMRKLIADGDSEGGNSSRRRGIRTSR